MHSRPGRSPLRKAATGALVDLIGGLRLPLSYPTATSRSRTTPTPRQASKEATLHLASMRRSRIRRLISEDDRKEQCESSALPGPSSKPHRGHPTVTFDGRRAHTRWNGTALLGTSAERLVQYATCLCSTMSDLPLPSKQLYFAAFDDEVSDEEGLPLPAPERVVFGALQALEPAYDLLSSRQKPSVPSRCRNGLTSGGTCATPGRLRASQQLEAEHHAKQAAAIDAAARIWRHGATRPQRGLQRPDEDFCNFDDDDDHQFGEAFTGRRAGSHRARIVLRSPSTAPREPLRLSITCDLAKQDSGEAEVGRTR